MAINCIENMDNAVIPELTLKELVRANSRMLRPFQLFLSDEAERLYCNEVIRIIPRKRLVAYGTLGGKDVVAKLFYMRGKAKRHLERDVLGIDALMQANVPTPKILYQGSAFNKRVKIVIFERIFQAKSLETLWQEQKDSDSFVNLMKNVILELATQHVLGILQRDLHLKNFLVAENRIYTLDGGTIEKFPDVLGKKHSIDNLSLFFAQLGAGTTDLQRELFQIYVKARGWLVKPDDFDFIKASVVAKNKERWMRYKKKIMRTCTQYVKLQQFNQSAMIDRTYQSDAFLTLLQDPDKFFALQQVSILKKGRTSTVAKIMLEGRTLVVKRYNIKNSWHWLRRCFRRTRAETSWRLSQKLRLFGISTAKPVAYIEKHFFGLKGKSYFVMEHVSGQTIGEFFSSCKAEDESSAKIAKMITEMFKSLGELRMTHGDLKMTNILLSDSCRPVLIDLDGMSEHRTTLGFKRTFKKEIARFMQNWDNHPSVRALFRALLCKSL